MTTELTSEYFHFIIHKFIDSLYIIHCTLIDTFNSLLDYSVQVVRKIRNQVVRKIKRK